MKRTHKRGALGDVSAVVAAAGSLAAAARKLGVHRSTVLRWVRKGQAPQAGSGRLQLPSPAQALTHPVEWAASVRALVADDPVSLELVTLAEQALRILRDPEAKPPVQLLAMGRFQSLVRQIQAATGIAKPAPFAAAVPRVRAIGGTDPRHILSAVK